MDTADSGEVWLEDTEICSLSEDEKAQLRLAKIGFVFQQMNMLKNLNILDNIMLPSVQLQKGRAHREKIKLRAEKLMQKMGIETLSTCKIHEVSGGQLQRACICRSLMNNPKMIFADEPTGALNQNAAREVMDELSKVNEGGTTILMVTHDSKVAARCGRILYLLDGRIVGELSLNSQGEKKEREEAVMKWLAEKGW